MASGTRPSTSPRYGSTVAVASMTNAQLAQYYYEDTRVGAGVQTGTNNGLQQRIADGRSVDIQIDHEDAAYIRRTLNNTN